MQPIANRYTRLVGIDHPIVQEGLGPFRTPRLAAAVSEAGGLGTVSMPGMPEDIAAGARTFREHILECASLTDRPFAVNIPVGVDSNGDVLPFTDSYLRTALEVREAEPEVARRLRVMTTSAGFPGRYVSLIKDAGMVHQHKVGSTRQAVKAAEAGVDVVIAAGFEMGGHAPSKAVHTFVLVPNVTEAVDVPVLLTGGARDGRGLAAALALGADGVAMGTRFITSTDNSDWHPAYLQALLDARGRRRRRVRRCLRPVPRPPQCRVAEPRRPRRNRPGRADPVEDRVDAARADRRRHREQPGDDRSGGGRDHRPHHGRRVRASHGRRGGRSPAVPGVVARCQSGMWWCTVATTHGLPARLAPVTRVTAIRRPAVTTSARKVAISPCGSGRG